MEKEFDPKTFDKLIQDHEVVILKFSAVWCGPCHALEDVLNKSFLPKYAKNKDIIFVKIDYDEHTKFCKKHKIDAVPCIKMWYKGVPVEFTSPVLKNGKPVMDKDGSPKTTSVNKIEGFRPDMTQALEQIIANLRKSNDGTVDLAESPIAE